MSKRPLAILLGITGDFAFAAGCVLQSLHRHNPGLDCDILLYADDALPANDRCLLESLGASILPFSPLNAAFPEAFLRKFSPLCLAKLEAFRLLDRYATVIWLDADIAIQDGIGGLAACGPFAMAVEDPAFGEKGVTSPAAINSFHPLPGLDPDKPNRNSGILVLWDSLPDPEGMYQICMDWLTEHAPHIKYPDQSVLNMLAQRLETADPPLFSAIPHDRFNAHPRNPRAQHAAIVHAFGAYKLWDDGLTRCSFPEWDRDYARWVALGGTPWNGDVENDVFLEGGAFAMLNKLYSLSAAAETKLGQLQDELRQERMIRERFESIARKLGG